MYHVNSMVWVRPQELVSLSPIKLSHVMGLWFVSHIAEEIEGGRGRGVKWDVEVEIRDPICISII